MEDKDAVVTMAPSVYVKVGDRVSECQLNINKSECASFDFFMSKIKEKSNLPANQTIHICTPSGEPVGDLNEIFSSEYLIASPHKNLYISFPISSMDDVSTSTSIISGPTKHSYDRHVKFILSFTTNSRVISYRFSIIEIKSLSRLISILALRHLVFQDCNLYDQSRKKIENLNEIEDRKVYICLRNDQSMSLKLLNKYIALGCFDWEYPNDRHRSSVFYTPRKNINHHPRKSGWVEQSNISCVSPTLSSQSTSMSDFVINDNPRKYYQICEILGKGFFSVVHKCYRRFDQHTFAIKCFSLQNSSFLSALNRNDENSPSSISLPSDLQENLMTEVRIMQLCSHPNVMRCYEMFSTSEIMAIVTEFVPHGDLFEEISRCGPILEQVSLKIMQNMASALHHIHQCGVVHRDVKPENILIFKDINDKIVNTKLGDFGLAVVLKTDGSKYNVLTECCGTPTYAAPEVLSRVPYSIPVDMWSLGVTFYGMLFASFPFFINPGELDDVLFSKIVDGKYEIPDNIKLSTFSIAILRLMLEVQPSSRITSFELEAKLSRRTS